MDSNNNFTEILMDQLKFGEVVHHAKFVLQKDYQIL